MPRVKPFITALTMDKYSVVYLPTPDSPSALYSAVKSNKAMNEKMQEGLVNVKKVDF